MVTVLFLFSESGLLSFWIFFLKSISHLSYNWTDQYQSIFINIESKKQPPKNNPPPPKKTSKPFKKQSPNGSRCILHTPVTTVNLDAESPQNKKNIWSKSPNVHRTWLANKNPQLLFCYPGITESYRVSFLVVRKQTTAATREAKMLKCGLLHLIFHSICKHYAALCCCISENNTVMLTSPGDMGENVSLFWYSSLLPECLAVLPSNNTM